ncbi:MAG: signal recognition particle-docking protein FtsY [Micrococcaceae bacterium]
MHELQHLLPEIITALTALVAGGGGYAWWRSSSKKEEYREDGSTLVEERPNAQEAESTGQGIAQEQQVEEKKPLRRLYDSPERLDTRLKRLRYRLSRSNSVLGKGLLALLSSDKITEDTWDELEESLLLADVGADSSIELVDGLREQVRVEGIENPEELRGMLKTALVNLIDPNLDRSLKIEGHPAVVLVVGVNGVGKTTTVGKLARIYVAENKKVLLGAADTFRAAAAQQLTTWGQRVGVETVTSIKEQGGDPAAVAFETVKRGKEEGDDVVLIDTAGRLQNKTGLMDELGKLKRVIEKQSELDEVLLVLDATTGQNGLTQAKVFAEVVNITGIVLTKMDGTAKGGIVIPIQRELGVPVKLIGLGEGPDDLAPFDPESFVDAILEQ